MYQENAGQFFGRFGRWMGVEEEFPAIRRNIGTLFGCPFITYDYRVEGEPIHAGLIDPDTILVVSQAEMSHELWVVRKKIRATYPIDISIISIDLIYEIASDIVGSVWYWLSK